MAFNNVGNIVTIYGNAQRACRCGSRCCIYFLKGPVKISSGGKSYIVSYARSDQIVEDNVYRIGAVNRTSNKVSRGCKGWWSVYIIL